MITQLVKPSVKLLHWTSRAQFKSTGYVLYAVQSGENTYHVTVINGKATGCVQSTGEDCRGWHYRHHCHHADYVEGIEQERREAEQAREAALTQLEREYDAAFLAAIVAQEEQVAIPAPSIDIDVVGAALAVFNQATMDAQIGDFYEIRGQEIAEARKAAGIEYPSCYADTSTKHWQREVC